jgi:Peptidase_C39 like family
MKNLYFAACIFFLAFNITFLEARMFHQKSIKKNWNKDNLLPFDELMITWNAKRPTNGRYLFYVRVKVDKWSPWLLYSTWGSDGQSSFKNTAKGAPIRVFQDALEVLEGRKATGFQIRVVLEGNSTLENIYGLHVYVNSDKGQISQCISNKKPVYLKLNGISQMKLNHARYADLCSPTSTSAVVRYLLNSTEINPIHFAQNSWDRGFDIFGNWVFNVAQASSELGSKWNCWVERLSGFDGIYEKLQHGMPVVVSIKGPIQGSALPYAQGHLLVVTGYDPLEERVICMDPAFSSDDQTKISYSLPDFVQAWERRGRVAYIFSEGI